MIGSWVCPISHPSLVAKDLAAADGASTMVGQGPNLYTPTMQHSEEVYKWQDYFSGIDSIASMPFSFAAKKAFGRKFAHEAGRRIPNLDRVFWANVTLFRRDNMKSVRIIDDDEADRWILDGEKQRFTCGGISLPFDKNGAGKTARTMMHDREIDDITCALEYTLVQSRWIRQRANLACQLPPGFGIWECLFSR